MLGARPLQAVLVLNGSDLSFSVSTQFSLVGRGRQLFLTMLVGGAAATPCPQDTEKEMTLPSPRATLLMLHRETVDHSAQLRTSSLFRSGFYENTLASHEKTKKLRYQSVISEVRRGRTVAFTKPIIIIFSILKW